MRPIEIIGGGLAGLGLGVALRRADVPVTVFEAGTYPRHRVCGEFITGLSAATIARLGLDSALEGALAHREVAWFHRGEFTRLQRLPEPALGISRYRLDARLAAEFGRLGGTLLTRQRAVPSPRREGQVLAAGRHRGRPAWLGLKIHVRELRLERDLEVHLGDDAYVGLSRVESDRVNLCGLFRRRALCAKGADLLLGYLAAAGLSTLVARLNAAQPDPDSFCAVAALGFDRRVKPVEGVQIGDACAMIPPFTGNGMAMAFQSAECALQPLVSYARGEADWAEVVGVIHHRLQRRFRLRLASASLLHPFLLRPRRQAWLSRLGRSRLLPLRPLYASLH